MNQTKACSVTLNKEAKEPDQVIKPEQSLLRKRMDTLFQENWSPIKGASDLEDPKKLSINKKKFFSKNYEKNQENLRSKIDKVQFDESVELKGVFELSCK